MIMIIITTTVVGKGLLFEKRKKQGQKRYVPIYRATAYNKAFGRAFEFAVTRDASRLVFDKNQDPFGPLGMCPPSKPNFPYIARTSRTSENYFCLRLSEPGVTQEPFGLIGQGNTLRKNIMIHEGPGMSEGCLAVAGGKKGHRRFARWFTEQGLANDVMVVIEPFTDP